MKKTEIVRKIVAWMKKNGLLTDTCIYFNNKRWYFDSDGSKKVEEDIDVEDYLEYGNRDTICMSFEGGLYNVLNYDFEYKHYEKLEQEFSAILKSYGYYYEMGHSWNLNVCE